MATVKTIYICLAIGTVFIGILLLGSIDEHFLKRLWHCRVRNAPFKEGAGTHDYCSDCSLHTMYNGHDRCNGVRW